MALSEKQEKELRQTADGLRESISALENVKDGVDRSATIAMEKGLLASIESRFKQPIPEPVAESPTPETLTES